MDKIEILMHKGVKIPNPESVEIGEDVNTDRISGENVVIHSGCKIFGSSTLILSGTHLGYEGPVTVENCYIGSKVRLACGFFKNAVFLNKVQVGYGAHVREGTILEEMASVAHTVGLKQTILFPFVTLGSLINFCDCLMAGGTSRNDHSEVGSSYIHFNYSPNQDKATASLLGDVPRGVMLDQPPIFLGGQGGLVGPSRIAFGTVIAAGAIYRKDELKPGKLLMPGHTKGISTTYTHGLYRSIKRIVANNIHYIANLIALSQWYVRVRSLFVSKECPDVLLQGCIETLNRNINERIKRLGLFSQKLPQSVKLYQDILKTRTHPVIDQKLEFNQRWPEIEALLSDYSNIDENPAVMDPFLSSLTRQVNESGNDYIAVIRGLDQSLKDKGTQWLDHIVADVNAKVFGLLPTLNK